MTEIIVFSPYFNPTGRVRSSHRTVAAAVRAYRKTLPGEGWGVALRGVDAAEVAREIRRSTGDTVEVW